MTSRRLDDPVPSAKGETTRRAYMRLFDFVEAENAHWQLAHPLCLGKREGVAAHEAGHGIGLEAEYCGFVSAEIRCRFVEGRGLEWTGTAQPGMRLVNCKLKMPEFILAEAVVLIIGLAAGWVFAGENPFMCSSEFLNAASLAAEYGDREGMDFDQAFEILISRTARILHHNRAEHTWLMERLVRRKAVSRREPRVAEVLDRVRAVPGFALPPAPDEERALARHLAGAPTDLKTFAREVVRLTREARK